MTKKLVLSFRGMMTCVLRNPALSSFTFSSGSILVLLPLVVLSIHFSPTEAVIKLPGNAKVEALIVFGDSIVDTGNNNDLVTIAKSNFLPYGRDFEGGKPTGRFSNGKVPSDLVAQELGIKELLPAYKDPNLQANDLLTGVNFASGGSGYDPLTSKVASVTSLEGQLDQFKEYKEKLEAILGEEAAMDRLAKTFFVVVQSSNDIATTYYDSRIRESQYDIDSYTTLLVQSASAFLKELHGLGARRIGVFGAPPLGCVPSQRLLSGGINRDCNEEYNRGSQLFNSKLAAELSSMNSQLNCGRIVYVDVYTPLLDLIKNPTKYGFKIVNRGCCGMGNLEVSIFCNQYDPGTCTNSTDHVFWDAFHPTERAYKILVSGILRKYVNSLFGGESHC